MSGRAQPRPPYTQTLTKLKKAELIRLCLDLRLPSVGTALNLRNQLKIHLNSHRNTLYRNPRYNRLYPKHRRPNQPPSPSPDPPSDSISSRASSPALSYASDNSWQGIGDQPQQLIIPDHPQLQPPQLLPPQVLLTPLHSPPNSIAATEISIPPLENQQAVGCEYIFFIIKTRFHACPRRFLFLCRI